MPHCRRRERPWPCVYVTSDKGFSSQTVRRDQGGRGNVQMITSTSFLHLHLGNIQPLKPLTVGAKGPKRIHERLGTSATQEDAVNCSLFCCKKDFPETNKMSL